MTLLSYFPFRYFMQGRKLHFSRHILSNFSNATATDFPWKQHRYDIFGKDSLIHRLVGMYMFRRMLNHIKCSFDFKEFSVGVKEAVKVVSQCIGDEECCIKLKPFLGTLLHKQFSLAVDKLKQENKDILLNVEAVQGLYVTGARFIIGEVQPGDEYIIQTFGQKIVLSKSEIEEFEEEHPNDGLVTGFKYGKYFSEGALKKKICFQYDIVFKSQEQYVIYDQANGIDNINADFASCYHKWVFETPLTATPVDGFQLDWTIVDMDEHLKNKFKETVKEQNI